MTPIRSHTPADPWVKVYRECIVAAAIFAFIYLYRPSMDHELYHLEWGESWPSELKKKSVVVWWSVLLPTSQRPTVVSHFHTVLCSCSDVNEPGGKNDRWLNHIIKSNQCCCNQHCMTLSILFNGLKVSTVHALPRYVVWINQYIFKYLNKYQITSHLIWWRLLLDHSCSFLFHCINHLSNNVCII